MHLANERDTSAMNTAANQRLCRQDVLLHLGFAGMSGPRCITLTAHEQHQQHLTVKMKLAQSCRWPAAAGRQNATGRRRLIVHLVFVKQTTIWGGISLAHPSLESLVFIASRPLCIAMVWNREWKVCPALKVIPLRWVKHISPAHSYMRLHKTIGSSREVERERDRCRQ